MEKDEKKNIKKSKINITKDKIGVKKVNNKKNINNESDKNNSSVKPSASKKTVDTKKSDLNKKKSSNKLSKEQVRKVKKQLKSVKGEAKATYKPVNFSLVEVIVIILITGIVVSVCSGLIVFNNYDKIVSKNSSNSDKLNEFISSYNHIITNYIDEVDVDKLIDEAISAMYNYLGDSYSGYIDKETSDELQEQLAGKYDGIGVEITSDEKYIVITDVFENSPAEKAGIKIGDIIVKINGVDFKGKTAADMSSAVKGSDESSFEITYVRDEKEYTVKINKSEVFIDSVKSDVIDGVGYILIETFSATTTDQVKKKINNFDESIKSIVIDVRNNTGGYLSSAYTTADLFIEKDKIIYKLKDKEGKITNYLDKNEVKRKFDKISVLINQGSASASEILAAALSESANAILVGKKSFGKGSVQDMDVLSSGAMVKYTSSYWLTPNGNSINNKGLTPDIEIDNNEDEDIQLKKAIESVK